MDETAVANALASCEQELQAGRTPDLRALGFWRAVAAVKRHPELVERYATRIATIDRAAFRRRVRLAFPVALGVIVLDLGLFGGLVLLGIATVVDQCRDAQEQQPAEQPEVEQDHAEGHRER